jgi:hypothetical protein
MQFRPWIAAVSTTFVVGAVLVPSAVAGAATPVPNTATQELAFAPDGHTAYVLDNSSVDVVDLTTTPPSLKWNLQTGNAQRLAVSPDGSTLVTVGYASGRFGVSSSVSVVNLTTSPPTIESITNGFGFSTTGSVAISPNGVYALVTDSGPFSLPVIGGPPPAPTGHGFVDLLDLQSSPPTVLEQVSVGWEPGGIAIAPNGMSAWVVDHGPSSTAGPLELTRLDLTTFPIGVGAGTALGAGAAQPRVVLSPGGGHAYVGTSAVDLTQQPPVVTWTAPTSVTGSAAGITPDGRWVYFDNAQNPGFIADVSTNPPTVTNSFPAGCGHPVIAPDGSFLLCGVNTRDPIVPSISALAPSSGPQNGGTAVVVTGANLGGATAVNFGATPGTNILVSPGGTSLTVTSPAGTGTVPVTVTTSGGTSPVEAGDQFTYVPQVPVVVAIAPNSGPAVGGTQVLVAGIGFGGATAVDFGPGNPGTILSTSSNGIFILVAAPPGTGTVDVTVTNPAGTSLALPTDRFTYVPSAPPVVAGLAPNTGPAGGGTNILVAGSGFGGATAIDFGPGNPGTILGISSDGHYMGVVAPPGTGTVDVTVTTPQGTSAVTPVDHFTYNSTPPSVVGVAPNTGSSAGGTMVLIVGSNFAAVTSVHFGPNAAFVEGVSSDGHYLGVVAPPGVGTVDVTVTTAQGTSPAVVTDRFTYTGT